MIITSHLTVIFIYAIILSLSFTIVNVASPSYTIRGVLSMYQGNNITAIQSQHWLGESLTKLMEAQSYQSITIGAICKQADLSRQTFYNVFDNKEEVLRFCLRSCYEKQFRRFADKQNLSVAEIVDAFAIVVEENQQLLHLMIENALEGILADEMTKCISLFAGQFVCQEKKDEMLPYSEALLSGALGHLLVYWFRQKHPISIEKLTKLITEFLEGKLYELM